MSFPCDQCNKYFCFCVKSIKLHNFVSFITEQYENHIIRSEILPKIELVDCKFKSEKIKLDNSISSKSDNCLKNINSNDSKFELLCHEVMLSSPNFEKSSDSEK